MTSEDFQKYVVTNFGRSGEHSHEMMLAIAGLGIGGEAGEVQEHVKKHLRDGKSIVLNAALLLELGDVLHYLTYLTHRAGYTLNDVMTANVEKLDKRFAR